MTKIALVTGSSRGLGLEIAKTLSQQGVGVILTGRSQAQLDKALAQMDQGQHAAIAVDFLQAGGTESFLAELNKRQLAPNIIIHNLGGRVEGDNFPLNVDVLKQSMAMNLEVAVKLNEAFVPRMMEQKFGRIIHTGSDASLTGFASPAYVVAKAALNGYVKTSARFYAQHQVMICAVLPGILEHEGSAWAEKKVSQPEYYQSRVSQMPLGRFGESWEIASFVAELAGSESMMCAGGLFELRGGVS